MHFKTLQDILISCAVEKAHPVHCSQVSLRGPVIVEQGWPVAVGAIHVL